MDFISQSNTHKGTKQDENEMTRKLLQMVEIGFNTEMDFLVNSINDIVMTKHIINSSLNKRKCINSEDSMKNNMLHYITNTCNIEMAKYYIANEININKKNSEEQTPLLRSISLCNNFMTLLLIEKKANLNSKDGEGNTALSLAIMKGNIDIAIRLINEGADVNSQNNKNNTPLHLIVKHNLIQLVDLVISKGANVNALNDDGLTPICYSISRLKIFKKLMNNGADLNLILLDTILEAKSFTIFELLITRKVNYTNTLLHKAITLNKNHIFDLVMKLSIDINGQDSEGLTPLHYAVKYKNFYALKMLLKNNADFNKQDKMLYYPIDYTIIYRCSDHAQLLINNGAYLNINNTIIKDIKTINALIKGKYDLDNLDKYKLLQDAIKADNLDVFKFLISFNTSIDYKFIKILVKMYKTNKKQNQCLNYFIENNLNNHNKRYVYIKLTKYGFLEIIKRLDDYIDFKFKYGQTALHIATEYNQMKIVHYVIKNGMDINAVDNDGDTALHVALECDNNEIIKYLVFYEADQLIKNRHSQSPIELAVEYNVEHLLNKSIKSNPYIDTENMCKVCYISFDEPENISKKYAFKCGHLHCTSCINYMHEHLNFSCSICRALCYDLIDLYI